MFGVEFMAGATLFALINLTIFLVVAFVLYRIAKKLYKFANDDSPEKTVSIKKEIFALGLMILASVFFGSLAQPKISIDTPPNRDLIEYQENNREVVIEEVAPRTETLEGFDPLKKN